MVATYFMSKEKYTENKKQLVNYRRENNLCTTCGNPTNGTSSMCDFHLEKKRLYAYEFRRKKCPVCGGKIEIAGHCKICWDNKKTNNKNLRKIKKENGICYTCSNSIVEGHSHCESCLDKIRIRTQEKRQERIEKKLCRRCGKNSICHMSTRCKICFLKELSYSHFGNRQFCDFLQKIFDEQNGVCPYTGFKLDLGVNASLDHKIPTSRGGTNDFNNLQWVYMNGFFDVNRMKMDMTDEEFREAINIFKERHEL